MSGSAIGILTYTFPAVDWETENLISGGNYSLREGTSQHDLTEIGTTGIYTIPSGLSGATDYTVYDNATGLTKKLANGDDEIYTYLDPNTISY